MLVLHLPFKRLHLGVQCVSSARESWHGIYLNFRLPCSVCVEALIVHPQKIAHDQGNYATCSIPFYPSFYDTYNWECYNLRKSFPKELIGYSLPSIIVISIKDIVAVVVTSGWITRIDVHLYPMPTYAISGLLFPTTNAWHTRGSGQV